MQCFTGDILQVMHVLSEKLKCNNFPKSPNVFEAFSVSLEESVLPVSYAFELFECCVCMLLNCLSVLSCGYLFTRMSPSFVHMFPEDGGISGLPLSLGI